LYLSEEENKEENKGKSLAASKIDRRKARYENDGDKDNTVVEENSNEPVKYHDNE
jgi:hypothetical protein